MSSLNQIADIILAGLDKRLDDIMREEVKFAIHYWRAEFIRQDVERNRENSLYLQTTRIPLIKVDKFDPCAEVVNCPVLRSEFVIPSPIRLKDNPLFKFVGEIGRAKIWTLIELESLRFSYQNKWTKNAIKYTYTNGYLYVFNNLKYKFAEIEAAFANPFEVNNICGNEVCFTDDDEYPLPADMLRAITEGIITGNLRLLAKDVEVKYEGK